MQDNHNQNDNNSFYEELDPKNLTPEETEENTPAAEQVSEPRPEIDPRDARIAELEEQAATANDRALRALAELENFRRRAAKEREDAGSYGISKFARDLLSVSDNLRRALDAAPEKTPELEALLTGIEATERELLKTFEQNGIQKIEPLDEKFDPNFHEVMFEAPMPGKPNGTVIQVIEAGYVLKGRLLRPARVGIAKNPDEPPKDTDGHMIDEKA